jgi:hypothetical protein
LFYSKVVEDTTAGKKTNNDQGIISDTATGLHYKAGDEPEPIDLSHLNVEAAMMCLASKVRILCGKANSPTLSSRTFRFKELDNKRNSSAGLSANISDVANNFKIPDVPKPQDLEAIDDWTAELRPSMRKLRQVLVTCFFAPNPKSRLFEGQNNIDTFSLLGKAWTASVKLPNWPAQF